MCCHPLKHLLSVYVCPALTRVLGRPVDGDVRPARSTSWYRVSPPARTAGLATEALLDTMGSIEWLHIVLRAAASGRLNRWASRETDYASSAWDWHTVLVQKGVRLSHPSIERTMYRCISEPFSCIVSLHGRVLPHVWAFFATEAWRSRAIHPDNVGLTSEVPR